MFTKQQNKPKNCIIDTSTWISARNHMIQQNEQVPFGMGSPFIPIISKSIIPTQKSTIKLTDEMEEIGFVDIELLIAAKSLSAELISHDKKLVSYALSHNIQAKFLKTNKQAFKEVKKLKNRKLVVPHNQIQELVRFGVIE